LQSGGKLAVLFGLQCCLSGCTAYIGDAKNALFELFENPILPVLIYGVESWAAWKYIH